MTRDWPTYRHPLGLSFRHPAGWSLQHGQTALQVVPGDFDPNSELILVSGDAAGVSRIDDPALIAQIDEFIRQAQPGLRRGGDPAMIECPAGTGIELSYAGPLGDGRSGAALVCSVLVEGGVASLVAIATDDKMAQRKPALTEIFATFTVGGGNSAQPDQTVPQLDPNVVGVWRLSRARHDSDPLGGGTFDSSASTYALAADGTFTSRHTSFFDISLPGGGGGGSSSESASAGTWSANGEFLVMRNESGEVVVAGVYKVFRNGIELLPSGGGEMMLLERVQ